MVPRKKLIRITTIPASLKTLLKGQHRFMNDHYEVIGISSKGPDLEEVKNAEGIRVIPVEMTRTIAPFKDIVSVWKLYKIFKKEKPLIVHTHTPKAGIAGMTAAYFARVPLRLHTVAGLPLMEASGFKRRVLNFVEKLTYRFATNVYPNSQGLFDFILAENFTIGDKLKVIAKGSSNGIDTTHFDPSLYSSEASEKFREEIGIPKGHFVFVFIGRLVRDKGINELVATFQKLQQKYKNTSLLLVGPLETALDPLFPETLTTIDANAAVFSVGLVKDVRPYLACGDVLAFPSYREGFPNVVMQAGAMGLPSIVTNINGCNEIISEEKNGIIIPVKNKTALYEAMEKLIIDTQLLQKYASNARIAITSSYERQEVWARLLQEYRDLEENL